MKDVHDCASCGFVSTIASAFTRVYGVVVCNDCALDNGRDPDVTRWIAQASERLAASESATHRKRHDAARTSA